VDESKPLLYGTPALGHTGPGGAGGGGTQLAGGGGTQLSREACESLTLVKTAKEMSFSFGPSTLDMLLLADGCRVTRVAPATRPGRSGGGASRGSAGGGGGSGGGSGGSGGGSGGSELLAPPSGDRTCSDGGDNHDDALPAGGGAEAGVASQSPGPGPAPHVPFVPHFDAGSGGGDDECSEGEVSSLSTSLWWRRSVDLAADGYRAGLDSLSRGFNWAVGSLIPGGGGGGGGRGGGGWRGGSGELSSGGASGGNDVERRRRRRSLEREQKASKRARLSNNGGGSGGGGGGGNSGYCNPRGIPTTRRVQPSTHHAYKDDEIHVAVLDGLTHIVQWIKPARGRGGAASRRHRHGQGLTLVHFSAQPEPFLTQNTPSTPLTTPEHPQTTPKHALHTT